MILKGVGIRVEKKEVNRSMEKEIINWVEERVGEGKRGGRVVEVVTDSQGDKDEKE